MSPTPPTPSSAVAAAVSTSAGSSPTVAPELGKYGFSATPAGFGSFAGPFSGYTYPFSDPAAAMNNPYYTQSAASTAAIHQQAWNYHMGAPSTDALGMHRFTNASSLPGGSSRRKRRVLFNQSQVNHLLMSYKKKKYLTPGEREKLAQETGLSSNQVKIWFQNHRYKCKREGKEFVEGASDPMSPDDEGNGESRSPSQNATELCADVKTEGHSPTIGGFGVYGGEKDQCISDGGAYNSFPPNMPMNMSAVYQSGGTFAPFPPYPYAAQNSYGNPAAAYGFWPTSGNQP